jgi:hypothetical protein
VKQNTINPVLDSNEMFGHGPPPGRGGQLVRRRPKLAVVVEHDRRPKAEVDPFLSAATTPSLMKQNEIRIESPGVSSPDLLQQSAVPRLSAPCSARQIFLLPFKSCTTIFSKSRNRWWCPGKRLRRRPGKERQ